MMNKFSLVLVIITGLSGIFWCIKRLYVTTCYYNWCTFNLFKKIQKIFQTSKKFYVLILYCVNFFEFFASFFPMLLLVFMVRSFFFEPFQIPSGSMMPTLLMGDFILVKKFAYDIKNPINQKKIVKINYPKRGDVIVFKYPKDPKLDYIKRVIGEPGDKIVYNVISKQLLIYPNYVDDNNMYKPESVPIAYSDILPSKFVQVFYTNENGSVDTTFVDVDFDQKYSNGIRLIQTAESFDGIKHNILTMIPPGDEKFMKVYDSQCIQSLMSEWIVPAGKYFVMGDNRDNSSDSRYWGYVPENNIVGKATTIWMSLKKQEGKWPTGVRWNRIGNIIQ